MPWLAALVVAAAAVIRLATVLPDVANRYAFGWDSARRAVLDVRAGDALRAGHPLDFLWYVAGPETWPTLRLVPASIAHAAAGPWHAFAVEHAVSIAAIGGIPIAVAYAARAVSDGAVGATVVTLLATALLATNDALLQHGANGMLEPLSAALTTAAVAAWTVARARGNPRPWALAVLANLVFHTKWQHGLVVACAVLVLEWIDVATARRGLVAAQASGAQPSGPSAPSPSAATSPSPRSAVLAALRQGARDRSGAALLTVAALLFTLAAAIALTGGGAVAVAGVRVGLRTVHGPLAYGALAAFLFVQRAFWRERASLRAALPDRLRFAWAWVATPMAAWLLVPATWRLRTILVTSGTYDSGEPLPGFWARARFYPDAAWSTWTRGALHPALVALLAATALAAWRSPALRRRLAPLVVLVAVEWALLTFGTSHNFQARFAVNLAPAIAVALCSWAAMLPARWTIATGLAALVAIAVPSSAAWRRDPLIAVLSEGFDPVEHAVDCRALMEQLPVERLTIVNDAPLSHRQGCALWATVIARERHERPDPRGVILLTGRDEVADDAAPDLRGYRKTEDLITGPLRARVYERSR